MVQPVTDSLYPDNLCGLLSPWHTIGLFDATTAECKVPSHGVPSTASGEPAARTALDALADLAHHTAAPISVEHVPATNVCRRELHPYPAYARSPLHYYLRIDSDVEGMVPLNAGPRLRRGRDAAAGVPGPAACTGALPPCDILYIIHVTGLG